MYILDENVLYFSRKQVIIMTKMVFKFKKFQVSKD